MDDGMSAGRWQRIKRVFTKALAFKGPEREAFLEEACADDEVFCDEVRALLEAHEGSGRVDELQNKVMAPFYAQFNTHTLEGRRIGRYEITGELGQGGMGSVYLAKRADGQFEQQVALKLLRAGLTSQGQTERFLAERQILARLNHPNIARLIDGSVTEDGQPYFVMEYIEGRSLDEYCDTHQLSIPERLSLFLTVCNAVQYAHRALVVHRDLKPPNILVTGDRAIKLLDFGIAKLLDPEALPSHPVPHTRTGLFPMTPAYASPEQVHGETITTASDVYQLGVVLYELLTGRRPYHVSGRTPSEVERVICEQEPVRPSTAVTRAPTSDGEAKIIPKEIGRARQTSLEQLQSRLRGDLDTIVMKALRKEPDRRYESADQLAEDLRRHLEGRPVTAHPDTWGYRARKFTRRHRWGVAFAAAITILLIGYAATITWHSQQTQAALDQAQQEALKSEQVTQFMMGLFEASDPAEALGDTVTARVLLERGIERAEQLGNQPEVQAQMLAVVGRVYQSLGQYDDAEPILEQALTIRRNHFGVEHQEVAQSLSHLGSLLYRKGAYDKAEHLHREALTMRRTLFGAEHADVAASMHGLATVLHATGDYAAADSLYQDVLSMRRRLLGPEHPSVTTTLNRLGNLLQERGDYAGAERKLREALALRRQQVGRHHIDVATHLISLSLLLSYKGDYEEAEALNREGLAIYQEVLDDDHPSVAAALNNLAFIMYKQGNYAGALPLYHDALERYKAILGEEHPGIATMMNNLGAAHSRNGEYAAAESLYREALSMRRSLLGSDHPDVGTSLNNLGSLLRKRGEYDAAEGHLREAIALRRNVLGDDHPRLATSLKHLGHVHMRREDYEAAEALLRETLSIREGALPDDHPDVAEARSLLGACLTQLERYTEAETLLTEAHSILEEHEDGERDLRQEILEWLVSLYEAWGRPDSASQYRAMLVDFESQSQ